MRKYIKTEENLLEASQRFISAFYLSDRFSDDAHWMDDQDYARDQLALAARELVRSVDELPKDLQPVGWDTL